MCLRSRKTLNRNSAVAKTPCQFGFPTAASWEMSFRFLRHFRATRCFKTCIARETLPVFGSLNNRWKCSGITTFHDIAPHYKVKSASDFLKNFEEQVTPPGGTQKRLSMVSGFYVRMPCPEGSALPPKPVYTTSETAVGAARRTSGIVNLVSTGVTRHDNG